MKNIKFFIETVTFCQGNCQGCFFSDEERISGSFMKEENINLILTKFSEYIDNNYKNEDLDITIIFGQGDHLSITEKELNFFMNSLLIVKKFNPLIIFTTSAIVKTKELKSKVSIINNYAKHNNINILPAVVLDIKKILHKNFHSTYLENISILREVFGFLDLTINIGSDTIQFFSPESLKEFLEKNSFRHIEFNLIPTKTTINRFIINDNWLKILDWINKINEELNNSIYVFHSYYYQRLKNERKNSELNDLINYIKQTWEEHIYVDSFLNLMPASTGFLGNAIPYHSKITGKILPLTIKDFNGYQNLINTLSKKVIGNYLKDKNCNSCHFLNKCIDSGVDAFRTLDFKNINQDCFIGAKLIYSKLDKLNQEFTGVNKNIVNKSLIRDESFGIDEKTIVEFK